MTPDEIIEVLQGATAGRKWEIYLETTDTWRFNVDQSFGALMSIVSTGYTVRLSPLPEEITIPARVIPAPLREVPKDGTLVWAADPTLSTFSGSFTWNDGEWAVRQFERGLIYLKQKPSEQAGKAMCPYA